jgi:hypothetical protein
MVYGVYTMRRKQIYLEAEQNARIKALAARRGVPEALVIREALERYLAESPLVLDKPEDHPLWQIVGIVDDPDAPADLAENHDKYLYGNDN